MQSEERKQLEERRLNAVREAYWQATPSDSRDLDQLNDCLVAANILANPTQGQIKTFFMMLPAEVFGQALSWGFSDTEVRSQVYRFIEDNRQEVLEALGR